jgi:hypothetical protein
MNKESSTLSTHKFKIHGSKLKIKILTMKLIINSALLLGLALSAHAVIDCETEAVAYYDCLSGTTTETVCQALKDLFVDPGFGNDAPIAVLPTCDVFKADGTYCNCLGCQTEANAFLACVDEEIDTECNARVCDSASGIIISFFSMAIVAVAAVVTL